MKNTQRATMILRTTETTKRGALRETTKTESTPRTTLILRIIETRKKKSNQTTILTILLFLTIKHAT